MEHAKRGEAALDASDALSAAAHYTKALIEHPTSPDYFTHRSTAFVRCKPPRHDLALRDAEYAVLLGQKRQKREKIQRAQQRRVVALYGLGRYADAKQILEIMQKWRPNESKKDKMEHDFWMARITSKLRGDEDQTATDIPEYPTVELPDEKTLKSWLKTQLKNDGSFKFDEEEDTTTAPKPSVAAEEKNQAQRTVDAQTQAETKPATPQVAASSTPAPQQANKIQAIRHDWYQDNNSITITFYAKKVDKTKLQSSFTEDYVGMSFPHPDAPEEYSFMLDPTFASIDGTASTVKATGAKVEMKLIKKEKGIKWAALDNKYRPKSDKLPSAWTTKGDQDWDKKAEELTKKQPKKKKDKKGEGANSDSDVDSEYGDDAVDGFFKKIYAGADDDTRRAMMKSFQESNGTALSTNWSEVSKGKVEEVKSKDS